MSKYKVTPEQEQMLARCHELENRIKASQAQEPVAWTDGCLFGSMKLNDGCIPLFATPVIPPTEADLQSQLAAANSRIKVLDEANVQQAEEIERLKDTARMADLNYTALEKQNAKLAAEERKRAVPEGWKLVPIEPTAEMRMAGQGCYYHTPDSHWEVMLAAAPQPEDKP